MLQHPISFWNNPPDQINLRGCLDLPCSATAIVKGDSRSLSIAAASIIAKVTRDRIMVNLDAAHPGYAWASNMGYGTKAHCEALMRLGPTPEHRRSFAPVRAAGR